MPDVTMRSEVAERLRADLLAAIDQLEEAAAQPRTAAGEVEAVGKIEEAVKMLQARQRLGIAWCIEHAGVTLRLIGERLRLGISSVRLRYGDAERRTLDEL